MSDQGVIREMLDGKWLLRVMGGRELHLWEWRMRRVRSRKWEGGQVRPTPRGICASVSHVCFAFCLFFFSPFPTTDCILCLRPGTF